MLAILPEIHKKMPVRIANREDPTLFRLFLQKQSDLGLHCLSRPFWQATSVQNFRTSSVVRIYFSGYSSTSKLPPIQTGSAPTAKAKERMSWRNAKVNQSVGWGGGKKRGDRY